MKVSPIFRMIKSLIAVRIKGYLSELCLGRDLREARQCDSIIGKVKSPKKFEIYCGENMVEVGKSKVICKKNDGTFEMGWDILDFQSGQNERPMGYETEYFCEGESVCPFCGKTVHAKLSFWEYPVGALEGEPMVQTSEKDRQAIHQIAVPEVLFFDM